MPHIDIKISKSTDAQTKDKLQRAIAGSMELIPGKTAANTLICVSDNYSMYRDTECIEAAFADIRLYRESPEDNKRAFAERLFAIIEETLGIPPARVQINFIEMPCWASNGKFFDARRFNGEPKN